MEDLTINWWVIFTCIGVYWLGFSHGRKFDQDDELEEDSSNGKMTAYPFFVEIKNGMHYAFDRDTDEFLGQDADLNHLTNVIVAKKKPGYNFYLAMEKK